FLPSATATKTNASVATNRASSSAGFLSYLSGRCARIPRKTQDKEQSAKTTVPSLRIELCRERLIKPCSNQRAGSFSERRAARGSRGRFGEKRIVEIGERIPCQSQAFGESRTEIRERVCNLLVSP